MTYSDQILDYRLEFVPNNVEAEPEVDNLSDATQLILPHRNMPVFDDAT